MSLVCTPADAQTLVQLSPTVEQITSAPIYDPIADAVARFRAGPTLEATSQEVRPGWAPSEEQEEAPSYRSLMTEALVGKIKDGLVYDPVIDVARETLGVEGLGIGLSTGLKAVGGDLGGILDVPWAKIAGWLGGSEALSESIEGAVFWLGIAGALLQSPELNLGEIYPPRQLPDLMSTPEPPGGWISVSISGGGDVRTGVLWTSGGDGSWSAGASPFGGLPYGSDGAFQYYQGPAPLPVVPFEPPPETPPVAPPPVQPPPDPCEDVDNPDFCDVCPSECCEDCLTAVRQGDVRKVWHSRQATRDHTVAARESSTACADPAADCFCATRPQFCCDADRINCASLLRQRVFRRWKRHAH
jgi:hypothetical protein